MAGKTKEPLIHITRRGALPWYRSWAIRAGAVILSLLLCAVVTMVTTGDNPLSVFATIFEASFSSQRRTWVLFQNLAMLLSVSLAVVPAFRMRFWNLGAEGQMLAGALATSACMICLKDVLPNAALIPVMLVCSVAAGALWGAIPALCKAKWGTNETLFTLMMNYVATQIVAYFIIIWESPKGSGKIGIINAVSEAGWLPVIGGKQYLLIVISAVIVTVFMYIYLRYTKHGYELSVVGESQNTAKYVGINVGKVIVRTLILTGLICGFVGWLLVAGTDHTMTTTLEAGRGFLGVMVAWLAHFNPIGMVLSGLLLVFMGRGAGEISTTFGLNKSFGDILTGIILFFVIGSEFFINYQIHFRKSHRKEGADV